MNLEDFINKLSTLNLAFNTVVLAEDGKDFCSISNVESVEDLSKLLYVIATKEPKFKESLKVANLLLNMDVDREITKLN